MSPAPALQPVRVPPVKVWGVINLTPDRPEHVDKLYNSITQPRLPPGV